MPLSEDNDLLNLFVKEVSTTPFINTIKFGRLSITALQYILSCTLSILRLQNIYEVFRDSAIMAAKQVSNDVYISIYFM